jgi:hypothetical protein
MEGLLSPAQATYWFVQGMVLFWILHLLGLACFAYIVARRMVPLFKAAPDVRFDRPGERIAKVIRFFFAQWKHPRYRFAGVVHILVFAGFILLFARAISVLIMGVLPGFTAPGGAAYATLAQYMGTVVFLCMIVAAVRRLLFRPARYEVPERYGKADRFDPIFLLGLIAGLMLADAVFEASESAAHSLHGRELAALSMPWVLERGLESTSLPVLQQLHLGSYLAHEVLFFFLLCYRPFGIQFHVETSLFSIYFAKLDKGTVKPVRWGLDEAGLAQLKSFGVKTFEDFTWKHMLDFYSCADCGRCSRPDSSRSRGATTASRTTRFSAARKATARRSSAASTRTTRSGRAPPAAPARRSVRC